MSPVSTNVLQRVESPSNAFWTTASGGKQNTDQALLRRNGTPLGHVVRRTVQNGREVSFRAEQLAIATGSSPQHRCRLGRIKDRSPNLALILSRKTDDLRLLNGAARRFIGCRYDKIRKRPPLDFRGALQARKNLIRQARLKPGCGWCACFKSLTLYGRLTYGSTPHLSCDLHHQFQLLPLLLFGQ